MKKKRRLFIDRKDAKRVDKITGLGQICIDLKPDRCDSDVYINQKIDVTNLVNWLEEHNKTGDKLTYFHCFVTAIAKLIYDRERLNYFVANRHLYAHNEVVISFVAKISFDDASEEIMVLVPICKNDNVYTISKKITDRIDSFRKRDVSKKGANYLIDVLGKLPNIIRVPVVGLFKWCDKKGVLPSFVIRDNLYYSSIIVSNLGSIKCGAIYHNITNFGSCSSLATIGEIKNEIAIDNNSKKQTRKMCEFGINIDERIADGYYFAKSIKLFERYFENPELLEESVGTKAREFEIR